MKQETVEMMFKGKMIKVEITHFEPKESVAPYAAAGTEAVNLNLNMSDLAGGYKLEDLMEAFRAVKDKEHWKNPVNAVVPDGMDREMLAYAIWFYTGSVARFSKRKGVTKVKADGYFKAIGA